jgi:hypothetical protein
MFDKSSRAFCALFLSVTRLRKSQGLNKPAGCEDLKLGICWGDECDERF